MNVLGHSDQSVRSHSQAKKLKGLLLQNFNMPCAPLRSENLKFLMRQKDSNTSNIIQLLVNLSLYGGVYVLGGGVINLSKRSPAIYEKPCLFKILI